MCELHTCVCVCRAELKTLREELTDEYEADKHATLGQLSQQRDVEIMAARESWQRRVEDLLEQVTPSPLRKCISCLNLSQFASICHHVI